MFLRWVVKLLALTQFPSWRTTTCQLSVTAYSIYSRLPSILEAVPPSATWGRTMLWWQGPTHHRFILFQIFLLLATPNAYLKNYFLQTIIILPWFIANSLAINHLAKWNRTIIDTEQISLKCLLHIVPLVTSANIISSNKNRRKVFSFSLICPT